LQVSIAVFSGAVEKFFGQRWLSPPRKNWPLYAYGSPPQKMWLTMYLACVVTRKRSDQRHDPTLSVTSQTLHRRAPSTCSVHRATSFLPSPAPSCNSTTSAVRTCPPLSGCSSCDILPHLRRRHHRLRLMIAELHVSMRWADSIYLDCCIN